MTFLKVLLCLDGVVFLTNMVLSIFEKKLDREIAELDRELGKDYDENL